MNTNNNNLPSNLRWPTLIELLTLRCPVCWQGPMFSNPLRMHERCSACGHVFDQGHGYFLGAMYFSYTVVVLVAAAMITALRIAGVDWWPTFLIAAAMCPVVGPLVAFPYSRMLWVLIERRFLRDGVAEDEVLRAELARRRRAADARAAEAGASGAKQQAEDRDGQ